MAASPTRSSARVSPRSVIRVAAISAITASSVARLRAHRARARHVADRAVAHRGGERRVAVQGQVLGDGVEHAVALEDLALVREVDRRQLETLGAHVVPHVELRPVREREHAHVLAAAHAAVVEVPQLGPLAARVPLAEVVAEREHALLGPRALLVAPRAAERGVEPVLLDRVEQRGRLKLVARRLVAHAALVDRLLHRGHERVRHVAVAELDHLGEVVAGVDVHDSERHGARPERLARQVQQDDRVLAAGEQQHRPLELRRHLADDVDRLRLELVEVVHQTAHSPSPRWTSNGTFLVQSMNSFIVSRPNSTGMARSRTASSNPLVPTREA